MPTSYPRRRHSYDVWLQVESCRSAHAHSSHWCVKNDIVIKYHNWIRDTSSVTCTARENKRWNLEDLIIHDFVNRNRRQQTTGDIRRPHCAVQWTLQLLQCVDTRDKSDESHDVWRRLASSSHEVCRAVLGSEALMERDDADLHYLNDKCSKSLRNFFNENEFCLSQNEAEVEHCTVNIFGSYCKNGKCF
jgi:hypothetical protein